MFSIKESLRYGWNKSKEHLEVALFTTLLVLAVSSLTSGSPLGLLVMIFLIIIKIGYTKIFLRISDGETPKFVDIFQEYKIFWRYLGTTILTFLTIIGGLILIVIPGIFWAVRFSFSPLVVIDTKLGPVASMKESWAITRGSFWKLFLLWIVLGLFNFIGLILFGVGLLITVPVSTLAAVYVYRALSKAKAGVMAENPSTASPQTV